MVVCNRATCAIILLGLPCAYSSPPRAASFSSALLACFFSTHRQRGGSQAQLPLLCILPACLLHTEDGDAGKEGMDGQTRRWRRESRAPCCSQHKESQLILVPRSASIDVHVCVYGILLLPRRKGRRRLAMALTSTAAVAASSSLSASPSQLKV